MKNKVIRGITLITLLVLAMLYGAFSQRHQFFPHHLIEEAIKHTIELDKISPEALETNVNALIRIKEAGDIAGARRRLTDFLWGEKKGLPRSLPIVVRNFEDLRYRDIANLKSITKLIVRMEFGLESYAYHFIANVPNRKIILYHEGHAGDFYQSKSQISEFLRFGYSVVAFCMPLLGLNNKPEVYLPGIGKVKLTSHNEMKFLLPANGHPIKYFIEPVVVALNHLELEDRYHHVSMAGISGGGWTTTLAAAIDSRIKVSVPVAGSYPIYLRFNSMRDWGDWEQTEPELYEIANYLELYVLGAYGTARKQLQIINRYDPCCFGGTRWKTYKDTVASRVLNLGLGQFDLFMDDTHREHTVSEASVRRILMELDKSSGQLRR